MWASWSIPRYLEPPFSSETKALGAGWALALTGTDDLTAGWALALTGTDHLTAGWALALTKTDPLTAGWALSLSGTYSRLAGWALAVPGVTLLDAAWALARTASAALSAGWVVALGASVKEQILANLETTLQGVTTGSGYDTDVARVYRRPIPLPNVREKPAIMFGTTSTEKTQVPITASTVQLTVPLILIIDDDHSGETADLTAFLKDVENALQVDHTRGGYAVDTIDEGEEDYTEETDALLVTVKRYRIHYRHQVLDAETKV